MWPARRTPSLTRIIATPLCNEPHEIHDLRFTIDARLACAAAFRFSAFPLFSFRRHRHGIGGAKPARVMNSSVWLQHRAPQFYFSYGAGDSTANGFFYTNASRGGFTNPATMSGIFSNVPSGHWEITNVSGSLLYHKVDPCGASPDSGIIKYSGFQPPTVSIATGISNQSSVCVSIPRFRFWRLNTTNVAVATVSLKRERHPGGSRQSPPASQISRSSAAPGPK